MEIKPHDTSLRDSIPLASSNNVIGYAISLTSCGTEPYADAAAVLKHSIHLNSIRTPSSGSKYDYKMYAFVHPQALDCSEVYKSLGYEVMTTDTPVDVTKIKGEFLRTTVVKRGCCQEKEFIKLYVYTLLEHQAVVSLDLDTLVLRPMDELFDTIIHGPGQAEVEVMYPDEMRVKQVDAFFVRDYRSTPAGKKHVAIQGGFFVVRPDRSKFNEYLEIILEGDYREHSGWGGLGFGGTYGAQQIQGIVAYFYDHLHPGTAVELNKCVYDNMVDDPRNPAGKCRVRDSTDCEDCRKRNISDVKHMHFTMCAKPWYCPLLKAESLCYKFTYEWYRVRDKYEKSLKQSEDIISSKSNGKYFGFCNGFRRKAYTHMKHVVESDRQV
mmetsp:Transcript_14904/g.18731  ORF Transcript_14904/g.18731 Transcript_14904/m.18731 type:complete len:381 (+) Transcript_14904:1-1143(+)